MTTSHGDDIYEHAGFAVHFFPRTLVDTVADGWHLKEVQLSGRAPSPAACGA